MMKPRRILEVGCNIGYSALWMSTALRDGAVTDTIEVDRNIAQKAEFNFQVAGVSDIVNIYVGKGLDVIPHLNHTYDMIFIDAVKSEYPEYINNCLLYTSPSPRD